MTKLKEIRLIQDSLIDQLEAHRMEISKAAPQKEGYMIVIHTCEEYYDASVWKYNSDYNKEAVAKVEFNNIVQPETSYTKELEEYCKEVQIYLIEINEIESAIIIADRDQQGEITGEIVK